MSGLQVGIADCNETMIKSLSTVVDGNKDFNLIGAVKDGYEAYNLIRQKQPDVMILDLVMPKVDGFSLLEKVKSDTEIKKTPKFIMTTNINNEQIVKEAFRMGVSYFMLKPYDPEIIPNRIRQVASSSADGVQFLNSVGESEMQYYPETQLKNRIDDREVISEEELQMVITNHLRRMGVPAHIKGYRYLNSAIMLSIQDEEMIECVTKVLYPTVAKMHDTTASRVERAIRHSIEVAWCRGQIDEQNQMFGHTINAQKGKPTNSEFIAMIASQIQLNYIIK